jgi:colanic acid/amylovoran biosynthesis protein
MAGNMGGPALYISMVESLRQLVDNVEVTLLSKYPIDDRAPCEELNWRMVPFPTKVQLLCGVPFSVTYWMLCLLRLPRRWLARGPFAAYLENDLLVDLSGISFTDDRPLSGLVINCLWLLPTIATRIPWVKASQTMGPFTKLWVRVASRFFLTRAAALVARGANSAQLVRELLPGRKVYELPDIAFVLRPAPGEDIDDALASAGLEPGEQYCVIGPSFVVDTMIRRVTRESIYPRLMAKVTDELGELSGHKVLLLPHARATTGSSLDDLNVCEEILEMCEHSERVRVLRSKLSASVLKGIISRAEVAVGSRFHFMVAAMSSGVPGIAITWSHKYLEMMRMVGQERFAIAHDDLTKEILLAKVRELWANRGSVRREIAERLPEVKRRAAANANVAIEVLTDK